MLVITDDGRGFDLAAARVAVVQRTARPKADAVWLIRPGGAMTRRMSRNGEPGWNRTTNQQIKSLLLCQLSYGPTRVAGLPDPESAGPDKLRL